MAFVDQLKELMGKKNMKAVELARSTGLSEAAISDYLNGKKEPRGRQSIAIAKAFGVSLDTLWGVNNAKPADSEINKINDNDKKLLQKYHALDDYGQGTVNTILEREYKRCIIQKNSEFKHSTNSETVTHQMAAFDGAGVQTHTITKEQEEAGLEILKHLKEQQQKPKKNNLGNKIY